MKPTIRGYLQALGLNIGAEELDGRWGVDDRHRIAANWLEREAHIAEDVIREDEIEEEAMMSDDN